MITGIVAIQIALTACFQSELLNSIGDLPIETIEVIATARNERAYDAIAALLIFIFSLTLLEMRPTTMVEPRQSLFCQLVACADNNRHHLLAIHWSLPAKYCRR